MDYILKRINEKEFAMGMSRKWLITVLVSVIVGLISGLYAQPAETTEAPETTATTGDKKGGGVQNRLLNDFESSEDWRALATSPLGVTKIKKTVQQGEMMDVFNPKELTEDEKAKFVAGKNHVLGVKTNFVDRGFDRVEIKPPHEYVIRGLGRQLTVWVLGRQFRHTLWAKFRDYRGRFHKLRIGRLDYFGWRKLTITLPGWLPQSTRYALYDKNLHFVSLFVVSDKHEVGGQFYFYVDELKMKVDESDMAYPGSEIKDTW